jgi:hypothetical protein
VIVETLLGSLHVGPAALTVGAAMLLAVTAVVAVRVQELPLIELVTVNV